MNRGKPRLFHHLEDGSIRLNTTFVIERSVATLDTITLYGDMHAPSDRPTVHPRTLTVPAKIVFRLGADGKPEPVSVTLHPID